MTGQKLNALFGENVKRYRMEKGWTQTRLAKEIGISKGAICSYEQGRSFPTGRQLGLLGFALEVAVWRLFYREGE